MSDSLVTGTLHEVQRPGTRIAEVLRPRSWDEAVVLASGDPTPRPVAGATDLLVELARTPGTVGSRADEEPLADGVTLLDLWGIPGTTAIDRIDPGDGAGLAGNNGVVRLGAGVTHNEIVAAAGLDRALDFLRDACLEIGSPQLRNRATVAGNIVTASPANDTISALVALDASVDVESVRGARRIPVREFFTGFRTTVLEPGELVRSIAIPRWSPSTVGIWCKVGNRTAQAISVVHIGLVLERSADGVVTRADLALGSVAPTVECSAVARELLIGRQLDPDVIDEVAAAVARSITPIDDVRASADYRVEVTNTVVARALEALADDSGPVVRSVPLLASGAHHPSPPTTVVEATTQVRCTVNGNDVEAVPGDHNSLLDWIRAQGFTGTKEGCAEGECGACTVRLNGAAVMSCLVPIAQVDGGRVTTVEGLATDGRLHPVQQRFIDEFAVQCGYCTPGFLVAAAALHDEADERGDRPDAEAVRCGLAGNLCRCTGYYPIVDALADPARRDSA